ncbi:MAG TPA: serine/threonine-protein kinase [Gemmatirosa sp.]
MARAPAAEHWPAVKQLFWETAALPAAARDAHLAASTAHEAVRREVQRLLAADAAAGARFDGPSVTAAGWAAFLDGDVPPAAAGPPFDGSQLGPYRVGRRVGEGGMGTVYEAVRTDGAFAHRVAVKTVWRGADSTLMTRRLQSERQILASLTHPNIAQLLDGGTTADGLPYLVMEFVAGEPIDVYCDARRLPIPARLDLFRQVCAAVAHAHRALVIHRDLKPSNVFVTGEGTVKLLDFGVAKLLDGAGRPGTLTGAGLSPFTAAFAAPEQVRGGSVTTAADVYALGALLYLLLTGRTPLDADALSPAEAIIAVLDHPVPPLPDVVAPGDDAAARARALPSPARHARALGGDLDAIVRTALRKEPERRYGTVDALADDVKRYLRGDRVLARPDTLGYRARVFVRRRRALVAGLGVAGAALVAGSGIALWEARASQREAERSERVASFLEQLLGAPDVTTGGVVTRLGPHASLAQALDSAARRVPDAFAADPRTRARLYTAIGATYVAQDRAHEAATVLDSAVILARSSYGPRSTAFAEASLAAGLAALRTNGFAAAQRDLDAACAALPADAAARDDARGELRARVAGARATLALDRGRFGEADSLALAVVAAETARTNAPTAARAWAYRVLGTVHPGTARERDAYYARAIAVMDSLGAPLAVERLDAMLGRVGFLGGAGNAPAVADSVARDGIRLATLGYGAGSREAAHFRAYRSVVLLRRGDTVAAAAEADSALAILDALPGVVAPVRVDIVDNALAALAARGRWAEVLDRAERLRAFGRANDAPIATGNGALWATRAYLVRGDSATAAQRLQEALAARDATHTPSAPSREVRAQLDTLRARGFGGGR